MEIPNTFIIGAPKAGTTSLVHYLARHPQAFFCNPKEPGYWADDFPWLAQRNALPTLQHYLRLFDKAAGAPSVLGEASTMYLSSVRAARNILDFNPSARFIVALRNPVEVAQAYHMQKLLVYQETERDFERAWRLQTERARGKAIPRNCPSPEMLQYGAIPRFGTQVRRLTAVVPHDQLHFIRFEDFRDDPAAVYRSVLNFLGLADDGRSEFPVVGPARSHRFRRLAALFHDPPPIIRRGVTRLRRHLVRQRYSWVEATKRRMYRPESRVTLRPEFRNELIAAFSSEVQELEALLGWDLAAWRTPVAH